MLGPLLLTYRRQELLQLRPPPAVSSVLDVVPQEIRLKTRKRGQCGGVWARNSLRGYKPVLPAVIMGNVRSLVKKADELTALLRDDCLYWPGSLLCLAVR